MGSSLVHRARPRDKIVGAWGLPSFTVLAPAKIVKYIRGHMNDTNTNTVVIIIGTAIVVLLLVLVFGGGRMMTGGMMDWWR